MQRLASALLFQSRILSCAVADVALKAAFRRVHEAVWQGADATAQHLQGDVHQQLPPRYPLPGWPVALSPNAIKYRDALSGSCSPFNSCPVKGSTRRSRQWTKLLQCFWVGSLHHHRADLSQQPTQPHRFISSFSRSGHQRSNDSIISVSRQPVHPITSRSCSSRAATTTDSHQYVLDPVHSIDTTALLAQQHRLPKPNGRVAAVALSGGVDSAVSALLLKLQGYEVFGVYMHNWDTADEAGAGKPVCTSAADLDDAKLVCNALRIPLYEADFVSKYWNSVFEQFLAGLEQGLTPNPDLACNSYIKFGALQQFAVDKGAELLATGHYARLAWREAAGAGQQSLVQGTGSPCADVAGRGHATRVSQQTPILLKGGDPLKDQTYFLAGLHHTQLSRALFPIGHLAKSEVRRIAAAAGLPNVLTAKRSSAGICFIGRRSFAQFLENYITPQPGIYIDVDSNKTLGHCQNMLAVTIGQRAVGLGGQQTRVYVAGKDIASGTVYVAAGPEHPALYSSQALLISPSWVAGSPPAQLGSSKALSKPAAAKRGSSAASSVLCQQPHQPQQAWETSGTPHNSSVLTCEFKARYRQPSGKCAVHVKQQDEDFVSSTLCGLSSQLDDPSAGTVHGGTTKRDQQPVPEGLVVDLQVPLRGLTPGQMFVLYDGDVCLGSAMISQHGPTVWETLQ